MAFRQSAMLQELSCMHGFQSVCNATGAELHAWLHRWLSISRAWLSNSLQIQKVLFNQFPNRH